MKKIIVSVIIFTFSFSYSQITKERFVSNSINSFKEGEWLQFRVHYGFFNASEIELELEKKKIDNTPVFHAKGYGRSTGLLRFFFKVDDYENENLRENFRTYLFFKRKICLKKYVELFVR